MAKKAQITFFIIIGLILLVGVSIVFYLISQKEEMPVEEILYPEDIKPIANFITDCTRQAGIDAVIILGRQGGYITLPSSIANDATKHLALDEAGISKLPFWYFEAKTTMPSINFMENQIEDFVKTDTMRCLGNFRAFSDEFSILPLKDLRIKTTIAENDIVLEAFYPVKIKARNGLREHLTEKFVVKLPVRLKKAYDLASQIMFAENENSFIENTTLSLMIAHPDIPMNGMTVDCTPQQWRLADIKSKLQAVLKTAIPQIRIKNTVYPAFTENERFYENLVQLKERLERDQKEGSLACYIGSVEACKKLEESRYYPDYTPPDAWEYTHLFYDVDSEPNDLKVSFQYYPEMGMRITADPSRNGILSTALMRGPRKYLSMICLNAYHFVYNVNYPVRVAILDDKAFNGAGYTFEFAFPVLINDNTIAREKYSITTIPSFEPTDYCSDLGNAYYEFKAAGLYEDNLPPGDINDATISFSCGKQYCTLGKTIASGGEYKLKTKIPTGCSAPYMEAEKEGYLKNGAFLTNEQPSLIIPLRKLAKLSYTVIKHPYAEAEQRLYPERIIPPNRNDKIMMYIHLNGTDFDQFSQYPCSDCTISFLDDSAKYDIDIFLEREGKIIGGYSAKELQITSNDIGGKQTAVFHIYEFVPYPDSAERQAKQAEYFSSQSYTEILRPEFR